MAAEPTRKYEAGGAETTEKVTDPRLVSERFLGKKRFSPTDRKSSSKKTGGFRQNPGESLLRQDVSNELDVTALFSFLEEQIQYIREQGAKEAAKTLVKNLAQLVLFLGMKPWLYSISLKICFIQGVFAVISLFFICFQASVDQLLPEALTNIIGKVLEVVGVEATAPFGTIGLVFWGISFIIGIGSFTCFSIFFYLAKVNLMRSIVGSLVFFGCMALTILPVTNIFPWLFIWIWHVVRSETSFFRIGFEQFKSVHSLHKIATAMEKIFVSVTR